MKHISILKSFLLRFFVAITLVIASYNPSYHSYYHWMTESAGHLSIAHALLGVVLIIIWSVYIQATVRSLGTFGVFLAALFLISFTALILDWSYFPSIDNSVLIYLSEVIIAGILTIGLTWSHIRKYLTGQMDVSNVGNDEE